MNSQLNEILFSNTQKFVIEPGAYSDNLAMRRALSLNRNLSTLGYSLDMAGIQILASQSPAQMQQTWTELKTAIDHKTGASEFNSVDLFYPNFPEEVLAADEAALYLNAMLYYTFSQTDDERMKNIATMIHTAVAEEKQERLPLMEEYPRELKVINVAKDIDVYDFKCCFRNFGI